MEKPAESPGYLPRVSQESAYIPEYSKTERNFGTMNPPDMSKLYDGIDYDFRPKTFWISEAELLKAILCKLKGENAGR